MIVSKCPRTTSPDPQRRRHRTRRAVDSRPASGYRHERRSQRGAAGSLGGEELIIYPKLNRSPTSKGLHCFTIYQISIYLCKINIPIDTQSRSRLFEPIQPCRPPSTRPEPRHRLSLSLVRRTFEIGRRPNEAAWTETDPHRYPEGPALGTDCEIAE